MVCSFLYIMLSIWFVAFVTFIELSFDNQKLCFNFSVIFREMLNKPKILKEPPPHYHVISIEYILLVL